MEKMSIFALKEGKLTVSSKNFNGDFATISADDFPIELEVHEDQELVKVSSSNLKRILTKTTFFYGISRCSLLPKWLAFRAFRGS